MVCKIPDHAPDRRNPGAPGHHHQLAAAVVLIVEPVAVGAPHEYAVPLVALENLIGHLAYPADGQVHGSVPDAADGNGGLAVFGDGHLEELAGLYLPLIGHGEGVLDLCVLSHLHNFG